MIGGRRPSARAVAAVALGASTLVGHVGYPVVLGALTRVRRLRPEIRRSEAVAGFAPPITVLVPAYLERGVIADKVRNLRGTGYPGPLRILVVADGDAETAAAAGAAGAEVLLLPQRLGKAQAVNAGVAAAETEIVVFTDANSVLEAGALEALVAPFQGRLVGAVAGDKQEGERGERSYWRFSHRLKSMEDELGSTLGLDGGLAAVRRSAWRPIPADISNDDYWIALDLMERGYAVRYAPDALMTEESIGGLGRVWERRTRVLGGSLYVAWRKRHLLRPDAGLVSLEMWGHKVWRSTVGPLCHVGLLVLAVPAARRSWIARVFLAGHAYGVLTILRPRLPASALGQVLFLQAIALGGMLRVARGDRMLQWRKPAR
jgi:poly-beta-1,6-N-acetyl-D-glucosamine synthase